MKRVINLSDLSLVNEYLYVDESTGELLDVFDVWNDIFGHSPDPKVEIDLSPNLPRCPHLELLPYYLTGKLWDKCIEYAEIQAWYRELLGFDMELPPSEGLSPKECNHWTINYAFKD